MNHKVHISDLHFEHKTWKNELNFFKEEITTFENRLKEIVVKYSKADVLAELEHLQNSFIIQRNAIDKLKHEIGVRETKLVALAENHPIASDRILLDDHVGLRNDMITFRKLYLDLKHEVLTYSSKWM